MTPDQIEERRTFLIGKCHTRPPAENRSAPVHVTRRGEVGQRVIFIHGGVQGAGAASATFNCQHRLSDEGWRLEIVDRPGFGASPSHGVDDQEADARWIVDLLGDGAHLVGHSWGGAGALLATALRPDAVRSLTLIEPALHAVLAHAPEAQADPLVQADIARSADFLFASETPADYAIAFTRSLGNQRAATENPAALAIAHNPEIAAAVGCAFLHARAASASAVIIAASKVAAAERPVLVITGGWSSVFDAIGAAVARMTRGRHVVVEAPDHFIQLSAAGSFNHKLIDFLNRSAV